jgi:hypothetical protein
MFDPLSLIIFFFLLGSLVFTIWLGIKLFSNLASGSQYSSYNEESDKQLRQDSIEDSNGDGLVLFDDPLFPEEFDEDDDY